MDARARLAVELDDRGRSTPLIVHGEAPLLMRVTGTSCDGVTVHLVGGAAGPLGGDHLVTDVSVGPSARLRVRSVAASLAQPGRSAGAGSTAEVLATVGEAGFLDWRPEPMISVVGSRHTQTTTVAIADESAEVWWTDEVVLGRHGEDGGRLTMHQRFTVAGRPVVHHTVGFDGADRRDVGRHGRHRVAITAVHIGGAPHDREQPRVIVDTRVRIARLELDTSRTMWVALADDLDLARSGLEHVGCNSDTSRAGLQLTEPKQSRDNSLVEPNGSDSRARGRCR